MSGVVLTIRPQPGCSATVAAGKAAGLPIEGYPLFEVWPIAWNLPPLEDIDALLLGSANAVEYGGPAIERLRGKPAIAVGGATARAAEAAGFTVTAVGESNLQAMVETLVGPLKLLRVTGAEHLPLLAPPGIEIETRIAYDVIPFALPEAAAESLAAGGLVLLHSAAAARHFARECDRCTVPRSAVRLAALAPRIAEAAGDGWRDVRTASEPREAALLALAREMCHEPSGG